MSENMGPVSTRDDAAFEKRTSLLPLIEMVRCASGSHVVVSLAKDGIRWRDGSESACQCIANIVGACSVLPRTEFVSVLEEAEVERSEDAD